MIYLQVNDVLEFEPAADGPPPRLAVLYLSSNGEQAVTIDLSDSKSFPQFHLAADLQEDVEAGRARLCDPEVAPASCRATLSDKEIEARDRRWDAIGGIVQDEPAIYLSASRGALIRHLVEERGLNRNSVMNWAQMYWRGGKTPNALVGDWSKCGARGTERDEQEKKTGRPREFGILAGLNLDRRMRATIRKVIWNFWRKNRLLKLSQAYRIFCREVFFEQVQPPGKTDPVWVLKPAFRDTGAATRQQFAYHFYRYIDCMRLRREKRGPRIFDLNERGLPGTATAETRGPGSRYVIDSTILDVHVRSRINGKRLVGRPVLYVVIDVWSRLIVGIYVGIENASWSCAMMALANVVEDKVAFCRRYGIEIEPWEWRTAPMPDRLGADGGETASEHSDRLVLYFNTKVEIVTSYRGDLKGLVENVFEVLPAEMAPYVPGFIQPDYRQRGARDYRHEAALDIDDVTAMVIHLVLHRNNNVVLKKYDRDAGMPAAEVAPYAADLWEWGIVNRSGRFRAWPPEFVRFRLMPEAWATVDAHGLRHENIYYLSDEMIERGWLEKGRKNVFRARISFDPRDTDVVYLHMEGTPFGYEVCRINRARSRLYEGMSFWEAALEAWDCADALADGTARELASSINVTERVRGLAKAALTRRADDEGLSRAEQARMIRDNRAIERGVQQACDAAAFSLDPQVPSTATAPFPPPSQNAEDEDYGIDIFGIVEGS